MRATVASAEHLYAQGRRLDGSYHASEGTLALRFVERWAKSKSPRRERGREVRDSGSSYVARRLDCLASVCRPGGIFIPSRFKRVFVDDPAYGFPYLTGGSIVQADPLAGAKYLSRRFTANAEELSLHERMILVTCSGTIGNAVYVNRTFEGSVGSPDLLRVVASPDRIAPGYLYAFLSSPLGKALIERKTYGAVVPHIEAHHMLDLPIPRLDASIEHQIDGLIDRATTLRSEASDELSRASEALENEVGFLHPQKKFDHAFSIGGACIGREFSHRLDAFCYVGYVAEALQVLQQYTGRVVSAPDVGFSIYNPPLFKRMFAQEGHPYMSGVELYTLHPKTTRFLSRRGPDVDQYLVCEGMVLVQAAGQRYGLITSPLLVTTTLEGVAVTSDIVRIVHEDIVENGYICTLLASDFGRRLALRYSYGTSIPRLDVPRLARIGIPWPDSGIRREIGRTTVRAYGKRNQACALEDQAQTLLKESLSVEMSRK